MSAPIGNQFWKLRSKHGRDKLFATPELLWEAATEYFEWCDNHPWTKKDWVGKDAFEVEREVSRPYTLSGLCVYLDCSTSYFREFKRIIQDKDKDFLTVITRIEEVMFTQKFEGAAVGAFNANIISRDLGLTEKQTIEHGGQVSSSFKVEIIHPEEE